MTLKTGVMPDDNSVLHHRDNSYFKTLVSNSIPKYWKPIFKIAVIFQNIKFFLYFLSNKYSLDEHKRTAVYT